MRILALTIFLSLAAAVASAQEIIPPVSDADPHPILSTDAQWAGVASIIILGTFLAAGVVGPIVRMEVPQTVPEAFSHHEDPSHHAGTEDDRPAMPDADK
jgi:hypothetical protein